LADIEAAAQEALDGLFPVTVSSYNGSPINASNVARPEAKGPKPEIHYA
jgi:hypothetical protein